jgi:hypothetical protein
MRIVLDASLGARRLGLVSGSIRIAFGRLCVLTLLGSVGLANDLCQARAHGCHVQERPTLGYTTSTSTNQFELDPLWMPRFESEARVQVLPQPCSGAEAVGAAPQIRVPAMIREPGPYGAPGSIWSWVASFEPRTRTCDDPARIDRPPRLRTLAV